MMCETFRGFLLLCLVVVVQSCTSSMIRIESVPDKAEVTVSILGGNKRQVLGTTPLNQTEIPAEFKGMPVSLEISRQGFLTETIIVPDLSGINIDLRKTLTSIEAASAQDKIAAIEKTNRAVDLLFDAVNKAQMNNKDGAIRTLAEVKSKQPDLSATYEIEGNIYMMGGDYKSALASYTEALKYNPDQINLLQMKARLEKMLGITTLNPASRATASTPAADQPAVATPAVQAPPPQPVQLPATPETPAGGTQ